MYLNHHICRTSLGIFSTLSSFCTSFSFSASCIFLSFHCLHICDYWSLFVALINKSFKNASNFVRQYIIIFTWFNATLRNRSWIWFMALSTDEIAFAIGSNSALTLVDITWLNVWTFGPDIFPYFGYQIRTFETVTLFCWDLSNWFCQRFDRGLSRGCSRLRGLKSIIQLRIDGFSSGLTCSTTKDNSNYTYIKIC